MYDVVIVGGGAAGYYAGIHVAEARPDLKIAILERGKEVLSKVKISGGGRCNVTHAEFNPKDLASNYPRGERELLGPFHNYAPGDTISFFEKRGISLKIEEDGRMFPISDSSQTIIDCFTSEALKLGIETIKVCTVKGIEYLDQKNETYWNITTSKKSVRTKKLLLSTGSNPKIWNLLANLGHTIVPPVPSLFTFNINDERIKNIPGLSTNAEITILDNKKSSKVKTAQNQMLTSEGPLLITHWGMSGPVVLKLSAWGARLLESYKYKFKIKVNWVPQYHSDGLLELLMKVKQVEKKTILRTKVVDIPKRLWRNLVKASGIHDKLTWPEVSKSLLQELAIQLTQSVFFVHGKSTFKEEFVTAGGIDLKEINFRTFESKLLPNVFFAGEILDIDAITGGFNFQNAWTGGFLAAQGIVNSFENQ